ncbi:MAG: VCBS repeat-containing protein [Planctomycetes bacterium]|nr:VCBS repeat-containing protein [Planctomycetota bacterium]
MDFDGDGDNDLVVVCPDKPHNGTYFFENTEGNVKMPVFKPGVRISAGADNVQVCYVGGKARVMGPAREYVDFARRGLGLSKKFPLSPKLGHRGKIRADQWKYADFDGDGDLDLLCGEFLDKFTYFENIGSRRKPKYKAGQRLAFNGRPIAMDLQMIVPVAIDWDRDGVPELLVGAEDGFLYHQRRDR